MDACTTREFPADLLIGGTGVARPRARGRRVRAIGTGVAVGRCVRRSPRPVPGGSERGDRVASRRLVWGHRSRSGWWVLERWCAGIACSVGLGSECSVGLGSVGTNKGNALGGLAHGSLAHGSLPLAVRLSRSHSLRSMRPRTANPPRRCSRLRRSPKRGPRLLAAVSRLPAVAVRQYAAQAPRDRRSLIPRPSLCSGRASLGPGPPRPFIPPGAWFGLPVVARFVRDRSRPRGEPPFRPF